ncbi:MAG: TetR/AcrR family transcriptional regulator [Nocardioides sp.]|nr:TetR/AcrR family transcriptional regulator [Nocardioides sp.]
MPQTPRQRARAQTMDDIIRIGRAHLVENGAAALSLRAVARDLGVVPSAVYRYVANRDDLLTLLVVDGFDELGDAVDAALSQAPVGDFRGQFLLAAHALRAWALASPATYALLYGSPVPGYRAPDERTTGPGTRVVRRLIGIWDVAHHDGQLALHEVEVPATLSDDLETIRLELGVRVPDAVLARAATVWAAMIGCVSAEVFGLYGSDTFADTGALYDFQLAALADSVGFTSSR